MGLAWAGATHPLESVAAPGRRAGTLSQGTASLPPPSPFPAQNAQPQGSNREQARRGRVAGRQARH